VAGAIARKTRPSPSCQGTITSMFRMSVRRRGRQRSAYWWHVTGVTFGLWFKAAVIQWLRGDHADGGVNFHGLSAELLTIIGTSAAGLAVMRCPAGEPEA
jgi:hypothetical protein